jgi:hypothetical protein
VVAVDEKEIRPHLRVVKPEEDFKSVLQSAPDGALSEVTSGVKQPQSAQRDRIIDAALERSTLFHTPNGDSYATIDVDGRIQTWPVRSRDFRLYLQKLYFDASGRRQAAGAQAVAEAREVLEAIARIEGDQHEVFRRVAAVDGSIYLDLADDKWRCVEVTRSGWRVCDSSPVKFRRARGMLSLPVPVRGGSIAELRPLVNAERDDWILFLAWLVAALRGVGPFPVLAVHGQQGSAKSTLCRVARMLVDPNQAPIRAAPRDPRDLMIAAMNGWVVALDNLSVVPPWLSDALCRLATGGGFSARSLYTDDDETIFDAQRPVVINGIEEIATRGDLLDRCVILTLPVIAEQCRQTEQEFWTAFRGVHARLLGALLDAVSTALRTVDSVKLETKPRMADFAIWATAAAPALGFTAADFNQAYGNNRQNAVAIEMEAAPITEPLQTVLDSNQGEWEGSFSELLKRLNGAMGEKAQRPEGWPKSANVLSGALRRLAPTLAVARSIYVVHQRGGGKRTVRISSSPSAPSTPDSDDSDGRDDLFPLSSYRGVEREPGEEG